MLGGRPNDEPPETVLIDCSVERSGGKGLCEGGGFGVVRACSLGVGGEEALDEVEVDGDGGETEKDGSEVVAEGRERCMLFRAGKAGALSSSSLGAGAGGPRGARKVLTAASMMLVLTILRQSEYADVDCSD